MSLGVELSVSTTVSDLKDSGLPNSPEFLPHLCSHVPVSFMEKILSRESTSVQSFSYKENRPFDKLQFLTSVSQSLLPRPDYTDLWPELQL